MPLALFAVQIAFTRANGQIRYEELAESVRNPFWLEHRTIYDATSSNVGWYGALLLIYRSIGFDLHAARTLRLVLALVSLLALADLLRLRLGARRACLPLAAFGLSPTLLTFNTLQASFGLDLQVLPICLWLVDGIDANRPRGTFGRESTAAAIAMWTWMAYPAFVFFLPLLGGWWAVRLAPAIRAHGPRFALPHGALALIAFVLPLAFALAYVKDAGLVLSGIFRGGGHFAPSADTARSNLGALWGDLTDRGASYYFDLPAVELSSVYPVMALFAILAASGLAISRRARTRPVAIGAGVVLLANLIVGCSADGTPGLRRFTPLLASLYLLLVVAWDGVPDLPTSWARSLTAAACLALPLHNVLALPADWHHLARPSPYRESWFGSTTEPPARTLATLVDRAQQVELRLDCFHPEARNGCRYAEIFAAIAGACTWNHKA